MDGEVEVGCLQIGVFQICKNETGTFWVGHSETQEGAEFSEAALEDAMSSFFYEHI